MDCSKFSVVQVHFTDSVVSGLADLVYFWEPSKQTIGLGVALLTENDVVVFNKDFSQTLCF